MNSTRIPKSTWFDWYTIWCL